MDTVTAKAVTGLYVASARQVAGIAYLLTGHERVAARVVAEAFATAGLHPVRVGAWPAGPESWLRAEVVRRAERPGVRLRLLSLPAPRDPRDTPVVFGLAELPAHQRAALVLHHVAGLDADLVALETEATVGATSARIANAEAALAAMDPVLAVALPARLRAAARRAEVPLPAPAAVRALPGRRSGRAAALAGAGVLGLVLAPSLPERMGVGGPPQVTLAGAELSAADALEAALDQEERLRQDVLAEAYEAREIPGVEAPEPAWTDGTEPADFLPHRKKQPPVAKPERSGTARGYVEKAFVHDGKLFVKVDRPHKKGDARTRVFRVRDMAEVAPGQDLRAALPVSAPAGTARAAEAPMTLAQYLWLVQQREPGAADARMVLHYDERGRVTKIAEAEED